MVMDSAKARQRIESIHDLPTLPTVATQIVAMANSPKTNAADVGAMIEHDQALTTKVLKLVNSSFYGFPGQIKSIQHAVVILGFNKVKNVVLTASVFDLTKGRSGHKLELPLFWQHSLGTAIGAKIMAANFGQSGLQPDDAFVGGLLHDIGKLILDLHLTSEYLEVFDALEKTRGLIVDAEKEVLGFNHALVGSWIAEKWRLPPSLHNAIRFHHAPHQASGDREMASAVHLGDILARSFGIGNPGDSGVPPIQAALRQQYSLSTAFFDKVVEAFASELKKAVDFFDLIEA